MTKEEVLLQETKKIGNNGFHTLLYDGSRAEEVVFNSMDEYMKQCCLELLEYMAKNEVTCGVYGDGNRFWFKGQFISADQLFENFL